MNMHRILPCKLCGHESVACVEYTLIHENAQVCGRCADLIANVFSMKHSGRFLTWPNESFSVGRSRTRKSISAETRKKVMERDQYRCVKCQSYNELQLDHIFPHSKGGSDDYENLQTLCGPCNRLKKAKVEEAA